MREGIKHEGLATNKHEKARKMFLNLTADEMVYKKWTPKIFLVITLLALIIFTVSSCNSNKISQGNEIISKIENYRNKNNKLPNSLSEIGIQETESGPIYYRKESESKYILWFGRELGESTTYDSETKQWK